MKNALILSCLFLGFCVQSGIAQRGYSDTRLRNDAPTETDWEDFDDSVQRKSKRWLGKPDKDTPADQLAYAHSLRRDGKTSKAYKAYQALVHEWHSSEQAAPAQFWSAILKEEQKKYTAAFDEYQYLVDYFSGNYAYGEVLERQFKIANKLMTDHSKGFLGLGKGQHPERALPMFKKIIENAPNWENTPKAMFYMGVIHEQKKDWDDAIHAYGRVQDRFPGSELAADSAYREALCVSEKAVRLQRDETAQRRALGTLQQFTRRYPNHDDIKEIEKRIAEIRNRLVNMYFERAEFYDKIADKPTSALICYEELVRMFPLSEQADQARDRIAELKPAGESSK